MNVFPRFFFGVALTAIGACVAVAAQSDPAVQIRFTDSATGYAIEPEHILVKPHGTETQEKNFGDLRASRDGRASISLEPGRYTITVTSPNHQSMSGEFEMTGNNLYRIQFLLDPLKEPRELQPDYIAALLRDDSTLIHGFVVDDNSGAPLSGVRVSSFPSGATGASDSRGYFQLFVPLQNGTEQPANLFFEKDGFRTEERQHLELWSRGDWNYRIQLERGNGRHVVDERTLRRRESAVAVPSEEQPNEPAAFTSESFASEESGPSVLGKIAAADTAATNATVRVPRNIRVLTRDGVTIDYVSMNTYARHVLPSEWYSSWHTNSLNAGAVALRSYAIARLNGRGPNSDYDICATSSCQVYNTANSSSRTTAAVNFTDNYVMINSNGNIASTEYSAENNSTATACGNGFTSPTGGCIYDPVCAGESRFGHGRGLCQWGSARWASGNRLAGRSNADTVSNGYPQRDWVWILNLYYPDLTLVKGAPLEIGDDVRSRSSDCNVRACPGGGIDDGVSCALITTKASGQTGVIIGGPLRITSDGKGFTWYQIQWNDAGPTIGWSAENYLERVFPTPTAPTGLIANPVSTNQINLVWTDTSIVENSFKIERAPAAIGPWLQIATVGPNVVSYSDKNLLSASTWHYRVRAANAGGNSSYTGVASATTGGGVSPTLSPISNRTVFSGTQIIFTNTAVAPERTQLITDFEAFSSEKANGVVLFRTPTHSTTTVNFINSASGVGRTNLAAVTDTFPIGGQATGKVLYVTCQFTNASNPWLRLTTADTATFPNPVIDFTKKLRFNIYSDNAIRVAVGCRETTTATGTAIGSNGGTTGSSIEWAGVTNSAGTAPMANRSIPAGVWTTLTFDFANESIRNFSGGNGVLSTASGLGVLEHLAIVPTVGTGVYKIYLDNFVVIGSPKLTYSLGAGAPTGANIHATTGVFTWTPSQEQTPSTNNIAVIVSDDSSPPLRATNTFTVIVKESVPNTAPQIAPIDNITVNAGTTVTFTNFAFDQNPGDTLTFSLDPGAPAAANVHPTTGVFNWTTSAADTNSVKHITVRVADDGTPPLSGTASFSVTVLPPNNSPQLAPVGNRIIHAGSIISFTNLAFDSDSGDTLTFSLDPVVPIGASIHSDTGVFTWVTSDNAANTTNFLTIRVTDNGSPPLSGTASLTITIRPKPTLGSTSVTNGAFTFNWSAIGDMNYQVQYKTNLNQPGWLVLGSVTSSGNTASFTDATGLKEERYYRVVDIP